MRTPSLFGEAADDAGYPEDDEGGEQQLLAVEDVAQASAEQEEAAVAEYVGGDDPLQAARRHAEVVLNVGQGWRQRRYVPGVEELDAAQDDEHDRRVGGEAAGECR